jgi:putative FmdB family regulatory protein
MALESTVRLGNVFEGKLMPTYEYSCNECGTYGSIQKSYDDDVTGMDCPKCNLQMSRIYSAPGLIFKGGGWGSKP